MPSLVLQDLPPQARIAVIRLRSLGDTLLTTPALAALKQWRPDLRITYVLEPHWAPVLAGNPDVESVLAFPGGLPARLAALRALRRFAPHLAVNLHGGATAARLTRLSGAAWRAGFAGQRHRWAYNLLVPPAAPPSGQPRLHTVEHMASLWYHLGLPCGPLGPLRLYPDPSARAEVRARLRRQGLTGRFAYVNAVPRSHTMQWPAERYVQVLQWLAREHGIGTVLARAAVRTAAGVEERIAAALPPGAVAVLAGTSVRELIALEAEADLVLGSDGGPMHIAAALAKPTVALFSATDAVVWRPWQTAARVVHNVYACNPCPADRCYAFARPECILSITCDQVRAAIADLLPPLHAERASGAAASRPGADH